MVYSSRASYLAIAGYEFYSFSWLTASPSSAYVPFVNQNNKKKKKKKKNPKWM